MPLLEGTDGVNKMSKSLGNYIGIEEPAREIVGKVMSISDELMVKYYELVGDVTPDELDTLKKGLSSGAKHPREAKMALARRIAARFHNAEEAAQAEEGFNAQFRNKEVPKDIVEYRWENPKDKLVAILARVGEVKSISDGRRLIKQGAIFVNGEKVLDTELVLGFGLSEYTIRLGKKRYVKLLPQKSMLEVLAEEIKKGTSLNKPDE